MITVNSFYESIPAVNLQDQDPATVLNKSSITNGFLKLFQIFQCFCQILSLSRRYAQKKEKLFNIGELSPNALLVLLNVSIYFIDSYLF